MTFFIFVDDDARCPALLCVYHTHCHMYVTHFVKCMSYTLSLTLSRTCHTHCHTHSHVHFTHFVTLFDDSTLQTGGETPHNAKHDMTLGRLRWVGSLKSHVSFAKEPYKKDYVLQKRPVIWRSLLIVAIPYSFQICRWWCVMSHTHTHTHTHTHILSCAYRTHWGTHTHDISVRCHVCAQMCEFFFIDFLFISVSVLEHAHMKCVC